MSNFADFNSSKVWNSIADKQWLKFRVRSCKTMNIIYNGIPFWGALIYLFKNFVLSIRVKNTYL